MVTRISRSIAAIGLAVIMICMFAFPTVASVAAAQPKRIINVQVIYDESFRAFALNELGENPLQRLRAALKYAAYPYERIWNVDLRFNFQTYESMLGSPYSVQPAWPDSCSALWSWQTDPQTGERYRSWNHYSDGCTCLPDDECFTDLNTPGHHNSALRLLQEIASAIDSVPDSFYTFDATACFVGHTICLYQNEYERHKNPQEYPYPPMMFWLCQRFTVSKTKIHQASLHSILLRKTLCRMLESSSMNFRICSAFPMLYARQMNPA